MAEITNLVASFPDVEVYITYDDVSLDIVRVQVFNYSLVDITCTVNKLDNPKRTYEHTWTPGDTTSFGVPKGAKFTWDAVDNNITMTNLEFFARYG